MEKIKVFGEELKELISRKNIRKIIFIGGSDTGKTTLLKDICRFLLTIEISPGIVDCDVGQSFVGPPSTISFVKIKNRVFEFFPFPDRFYFTGAITPGANIVGFLTGIEKMRGVIERERGKILIDTTGYIKVYTYVYKAEPKKSYYYQTCTRTPICDNACSSGDRRCSPTGTEYQECVQDTYGCWDWGGAISCGADKYCLNGDCIIKHATYGCYDNDVYWYDELGNRDDKKEECGYDSCENWSEPYLINDTWYASRAVSYTHLTLPTN